MSKQTEWVNWIDAQWPAPAHIRAGTTTRVSGKSLPPYDSFNLAAHVEDNFENVVANRNQLIKQLDLPSTPVWINQVHGSTILDTATAKDGEKADGTYANCRSSVCMVLTADCVPVLVCNKDGTEIAALHAGWRGLCNGVIQYGIEKFFSKRKDIMAWIGPHIHAESYSVKSDMYEACLSALGDNIGKAFTQESDNVYYASLSEMVSLELRNHGVSDIYVSEYCCYKENNLFYSYRRDGQTGRMASLIWM